MALGDDAGTLLLLAWTVCLMATCVIAGLRLGSYYGRRRGVQARGATIGAAAGLLAAIVIFFAIFG